MASQPTSRASRSADRAGKAFWDATWAHARGGRRAVDPRDASLINFPVRQFHEYFRAELAPRMPRPARLLEIGCANSSWLPYFAREFGFDVCGLDYSELGCEQAREVLRSAGVTGRVVHADLYAPPADLVEAFDVVVSFGVVEHFDDTAACLGAVGRFLRPGGLAFTNIPNLSGWCGTMQRVLNRRVYDIHRPLNREQLAQAHRDAGLSVLECSYFLGTSFAVCNLDGLARNPEWLAKKIGLAGLTRVSMVDWLLASRGAGIPANRLSSPYINCLSVKPVPDGTVPDR